MLRSFRWNHSRPSPGNRAILFSFFLPIVFLLLASADNLCAQQDAAVPPADESLMMKWYFGEPYNPKTDLMDEPKQLEGNPEPLSMSPPAFPESMRKEGLQGMTYLRMLIGRDGKPRKGFIVKMEGGNDDMARASLEAAKEWIFKPGEMNGAPVEAWVVIPLKFKLQ